MKRTFLVMLALAPLSGWCGDARSDVVRTVTDLNAALTNDAPIGIAFDITAQALFPPQSYRTWFSIIRDAVQDEIDPRYVFFALNSASETFFLPAFCASNELSRAESLIGSHVSVTGIPSSDYGQWIVACGIPEFDLYNVNLSRARWRATASHPTVPEDETTVSAAKILYDENGQLHILTSTVNGQASDAIPASARGTFHQLKNG